MSYGKELVPVDIFLNKKYLDHKRCCCVYSLPY